MTSPAKHFLVVSSPMFGHAIPMLQFALKVSQFHTVTFAVSECSLKGLRNELTEAENAQLKFIGISGINGSHEFDSYAVNPAGKLFEVLFPDIKEFFRTIPTKNDPTIATSQLISLSGDGFATPVAVVIVDNFLGGPASVLHPRGVPYYLFNTSKAWLIQCFLTLDIDEPKDFPLSLTTPPNFARRSIGAKYFDINLEGNKHLLMDNCQSVHLAAGILNNSLREAEADVLDEIKTLPGMANMKQFCVGPLVPETGISTANGKLITSWLDFQAENSVVYVSFGSIAAPAPGDILEISKALLALKVPFIWSLKPVHYAHLPQEIQNTLNADKEVSKKRPYLIVPWAPQRDILAHPATKVFVSHCGWNSTVESLTSGVPVVAWPMFADQLMNGQWLEKIGAGKLIPGTGFLAEKAVPADYLIGVLKELLQNGPEKNTYTESARRWQSNIRIALAPGGSSYRDFQEFIEYIN